MKTKLINPLIAILMLIISTNLSAQVVEAGKDQHVCGSSAVLSGNIPTSGIGKWTTTSQASITYKNQYNTTVHALSTGINRFTWTITDDFGSSSDEVAITNDKPTTATVAQISGFICENEVDISANMPSIGTGVWSSIFETGDILDVNNAATKVTNLHYGTNKYRWTITKKACTSFAEVIVENKQVVANAGTDEDVCGTETTLNGNTPPTSVTGNWSIESEIVDQIIANKSQRNTTVTNLKNGSNTFRWSLNNGTCNHYDEVTITNNRYIADAGPDVEICDDNTTFNAVGLPAGVVGTWEVMDDGSANVYDVTDWSSQVTNLQKGVNKFKWTVERSGCSTTDEVKITNNTPLAEAGSDQNNCADEATLDATTPIFGTGKWSTTSSEASIANTADKNSIVSNLQNGKNNFTWIVSHKGCDAEDNVDIYNYEFSVRISTKEKSVCSSTATLQASAPSTGYIGTWTALNGTPIISNASLAFTTVSELPLGTTTFEWKVEKDGCIAVDYATRTNNNYIADAGSDQVICNTSTDLLAVSPVKGTGMWILESGTGSLKYNKTGQEDETNKYKINAHVSEIDNGKSLFKWIVSYEGCESIDKVNVTSKVFYYSAGSEQTVCDHTAGLQAAIPANGGFGKWTDDAETVTFLNNTVNNTIVKNLARGLNKLNWTVTENDCSISSSVSIYNNKFDISAGNDKSLVSDSVSLNGTLPSPDAEGVWDVLGGKGIINIPDKPNTTATNLSYEQNNFRWSVYYNECSFYDDITITRVEIKSDAGHDQSICTNVTQLDATEAIGGSGFWTIVKGDCIFENSEVATTRAVDISRGENIFKWTVVVDGYYVADEVTINNMSFDISAGKNKFTFEDNIQMAAENPLNGDPNGEGWWIIEQGSGRPDGNTPSTMIYDLGMGVNKFTWKISRYVGPLFHGCEDIDTVTIVRLPYGFTLDAGPNQIVNENSTTLAAENLPVGVGRWTVFNDSSDFNNAAFSRATISKLQPGDNLLRWTVTDGISTIFDDVVITYKKDLASLSGKVYSGTSLVNDGIMILYKQQEYLKPTQYTNIVNGNYNFNVENGQYLLYAIPNNKLSPTYFPTYNGNVLKWQDAELILVDETISDIDINLYNSTKISSVGFIDGYLLYRNDLSYERYIYSDDWFGVDNVEIPENMTDKPAKNIPVILYNNNGEATAWTLANTVGYFEFDEIPYNSYIIEYEKAEYENKNAPSLTVSNNNKVHTDFEIYLETLDINEIDTQEDNKKITLYPNPSKDILNIKIEAPNENITIKIMNINGQVVISKSVNNTNINNTTKFDITNLPSGIYCTQIIMKNKLPVNTLFIKE